MTAPTPTAMACHLCRGTETLGYRLIERWGRFQLCSVCAARLTVGFWIAGRVGLSAFREFFRARWPELFADCQELYQHAKEAQALERARTGAK